MDWKSTLAGLLMAFGSGTSCVVPAQNSDGATGATDHAWRDYQANEVNFEFFAMGTLGRSSVSDIAPDDIERDGNFGPGLGIAYFPHRFFGLQGEAYSDSSRGSYFVDAAGAHFIGRFPAGAAGVAPYVLSGVGRQFDPGPQWTWDAGAGVEWRFLRHVGIFSDARYVWAEKSADFGYMRVGINFGF